MTTKVTVDAHAGWPVDVVINEKGLAPRIERVEPHTTKDFYVYDTKSISVIEVTSAGSVPPPSAG